MRPTPQCCWPWSALLAEIRRSAERPTSEDLWRRLRSRAEVSPSIAPAEAVRQERERR